MVKANLDFMQECQKALKQSTTETTEYEAVGINVAKKLDKMDNTQAIYAETLINLVLQKGLLKQLTANTIICESTKPNTGFNTFVFSSTPSTSSTPTPDITETLSPPNAQESLDKNNVNEENLQSNTIVRYYEDSASFFQL